MSSYAISLAPSARRARRWLPGTGDLSVDFLWLLLALTLLRGVIYAALNPGSPDERDHFQYVQNLATFGVSGDRGAEGHQPILYYALMVPAYWLTAGHSREVQLLAIRLASLPLLLLGTPLFAWLAARKMAPSKPLVPVIAAAFVGLHPQLAYITASANNDGAANLMAAVLTYLMMWLLSGEAGSRIVAVSAVAIGAALMTKGQIMPVVAIFSLVLVVGVARQLITARRRWQLLAVIPLLIVPILALKTYEGSVLLMRSLSALSLFTRWPETLQTIQRAGLGAVPYQFVSFWGAFVGESVQPAQWWYAAPTAATLLAVVGHAVWVTRPLPDMQVSPRPTMPVRMVLVLVVLGQWVALYLPYLQAYESAPAWVLQGLQGRYLFPALVPLSLLVAEGWSFMPAPRYRAVYSLAVVGILAAFDVASLAALTGYYRWPIGS